MYYEATATSYECGPKSRVIEREHGVRLQDVLSLLGNSMVEHTDIEEWTITVKVTR